MLTIRASKCDTIISSRPQLFLVGFMYKAATRKLLIQTDPPPTSVSGVFTGGLDTVSLSQHECMSYTPLPIDPGHPNQPYVIQFPHDPTLNGVRSVF
jgi:hypothetical protein